MKALLKKLKSFSDPVRKQSVSRCIITHHGSHMNPYLTPKSYYFFFSFFSFLPFLHKLCSWPFEWIYKIYFWPTFLLLLLRLSPRNLAEPKDLGARQRRPPKCCVSEQTFPSPTPSLLQFLCHPGQEQALKGRSLISLTRQRLNLTKTAASGGPQEQARTFWIFREENKLTSPAWSSVYAKLAGRDLQLWAETRFGFCRFGCPWKPIMGQKILINAKTQMNSRIGRKDDMINSKIVFVQRWCRESVSKNE